jgi:predicted alpha/beta-fold hydrolase
MISDLAGARAPQSRAQSLVAQPAADFENKPFIPYRPFRNGDAQTIGAYLWPARFTLRDETNDEERLFEVESESRVLARCRWQPNRSEHPTLVLWHGMEGSTASAYMLIMADKAFRASFNVIRVNVRNCGRTEHLTPTLYHGGMSGDVRAVIEELIDRDRLNRVFVAGFSLGGNKVLKMAGEYGDDPPPQLYGVCAVSPSVNLRASCDLLMARRNWVYHKDFLYYLKRRIPLKEKLFPGSYSLNALRSIRTLRQFDSTYIAPAFGFSNVDEYYAKASCQPLIPDIRVPTLIIHAQDDPFVPFEPILNSLLPLPTSGRTEGCARDGASDTPQGITAISSNPNILLLAPARGGHVAFMSRKTNDADRFWAENRVVEFCGKIDKVRLDKSYELVL